ncbi:MAG: aminopeptidase [Faecalibacterium prausnitzii]
MNDRVQWSIAAMPSAPWAKKMFPELDEAAAIEKLWQLIFDVCRVTGGDPVNEWKAHLDRLTSLKDKMNALDLESVHFESSNGTDLTVGIWPTRPLGRVPPASAKRAWSSCPTSPPRRSLPPPTRTR